MLDFTLKLPEYVFFGKNSMEKLKKQIGKFGRKTLIVTGKSSAIKSGALDDIITILKEKDIKYRIFDEIMSNPIDTIIDKGGMISKEIGANFLITIGGGSVMDAAKGIAVVHSNGGKIWDYIYDGRRSAKKIKKALPVIAIPTLAASGSELDGGAVITNEKTKEKIAFGSFHTIPKIAVLNPIYTFSTPKDYTAYGAADIISHLTEPFLGTREENSGISDQLISSLIRIVMKNLPKVLKKPEDYNSRAEIMLASSLALSGIPSIGTKGTFIMHYLEHPISGHLNIPHGKGLAAIFIPYFKAMKEINKKRLEKYFKLIFNSDIDEGIQKFEVWLKNNFLPLNLSEDGVNENNIKVFAEDCIRISSSGKGYLGEFRELDKIGIIEIYRQLIG